MRSRPPVRWRERGNSGQEVRADLADVCQRFLRLLVRRRQFASTLFGGERRMLALGRALMARPRLLMLDEPNLGLEGSAQALASNPRVVQTYLGLSGRSERAAS